MLVTTSTNHDVEPLTGLCARAVTSTMRERRRVAPKGDRRTTIWPARLAYWITHLADRADIGRSTDDTDGSGDGAAIGTGFYGVSKTLFFHSVHPPPVLIFNFCVGRR